MPSYCKNNFTISLQELKERLLYDGKRGCFTWKSSKCNSVKPGSAAGSLHYKGYITLSINCKQYWAHRLAWFYVYGKWPVKQIDHINGNRSDNRIENLREATNSDNKKNSKMRSDNKTGMKGVSFKIDLGKHIARIQVGKRRIYLGSFDNKYEAKAAYDAAALFYYGEFARAA